MKESLNLIRLLAVVGALMALVGTASAQEQPFRFAGTTCPATPYLHCPDSECSGATVVNQGNVVEMKTRRTYFLDYPCDLKKGEKVTFILSLHGFGSYGNWQRNYFPIMDYKDKYRLVIATPNASFAFPEAKMGAPYKAALQVPHGWDGTATTALSGKAPIASV